MERIEVMNELQKLIDKAVAAVDVKDPIALCNAIYKAIKDPPFPGYTMAVCDALFTARDAAIRSEGWISVEEKPESGKFVLCAIAGKKSPIRAFYAAPMSVECSDDDNYDHESYDEEKDEYFLAPGWYECNEYEENHYFVYDDITHWMPLPPPPAICRKEVVG